MKITIENHRNLLRLRWNDGNKRQTLSIGVAESPVGRSLAEIRKSQIELDWKTGHYDSTLVKYRPHTLGKNGTEISAPELFRRFGEYQLKNKGVSASSIESRYKPIVRILEKHVNKSAHQVGKYQVAHILPQNYISS